MPSRLAFRETALIAAVRMDRAHQYTHVIVRRVLGNAVSQIEDMARLGAESVEHAASLRRYLIS